MKNFFSNIWNFLKKPKVKIWLIAMMVVIFLTVGVMSLVMVLTPVHYGMQMQPQLENVYSIHFRNQHHTNSNGRELLNGNVGGTLDPESNSYRNQIVKDILDKLSTSGQTNRFAQVIGGAASGSEVVRRNNNHSTNSRSALTRVGTWIEITFNEPKFAIIRNNDTSPWRIKPFDPNYTQVDGVGPTAVVYNRDHIVRSILIQLDNVRNSFDEQIWHISVGSSTPNFVNRPTNFHHTLTTFANFRPLFNVVNGIEPFDI